MGESSVRDRIEEHRIVGIIRLDDLTHAVDISNALLRGGILVQEYTLSNPQALDALLQVRESVPEFQSKSALLGIGSVQTLEQAEAAIQAQVHFVVTPVFDSKIVSCCVEANMPIVCGAMTPTEILSAFNSGVTMVKVFPVRAFGTSYIRDLLAPMPHLPLVPTGGVNLENMKSYLQAGAKAVGIGGNLVAKPSVDQCDWGSIEAIASKYSNAAKQSREDV